jgi:hypothetical protein
MRFKELKVGTVGIQREEITEMDYVRKSKKKINLDPQMKPLVRKCTGSL